MSGQDREVAVAAPALFDGDRFLRDHCVVIAGDRVARVIPRGDYPAGADLVDLAEGTLAPGFIDLQVNGGGDALLHTDPTTDTVVAMLAAHRARGTTALLPTLLSDSREIQAAAATAVCEAAAAGNPGILGVHIEGPFFNPAKCGAHDRERLRTPAAADIEWLCALQQRLQVLTTVAPEQMPLRYVERLAGAGVIVCAGHSDADYDTVMSAAKRGLAGVTHLYNAMGGGTARRPGMVGAALDCDELWAGIIADGHHVHPAAIRLAHRAKPAGKLLLVSDAMATVGGRRKRFALYGEVIAERDGRLVNAAGALAGSAIGLIDAVAFCHRGAGIPLAHCLRMASLYPARALGVDQRLGRLQPGYRADLVHFSNDFTVRDTWLAGQRLRHDAGEAA